MASRKLPNVDVIGPKTQRLGDTHCPVTLLSKTAIHLGRHVLVDEKCHTPSSAVCAATNGSSSSR